MSRDVLSFVQPLLSVFVQLTALSLEMDFAAASLARDLLLDFMRDDPTVLCRSIMEAVSEGNDGLDTAVFALRSFLHVGKLLPPRLSHHVFGHLAGFLKYLARETDAPDSFRQLAHVIPSLAKYAPQVSDLSVQAVSKGEDRGIPVSIRPIMVSGIGASNIHVSERTRGRTRIHLKSFHRH